MKTTVAFLQNMWMTDPACGRAMIERGGEELRVRMVYQFLFNGKNYTGRRIKAAFGDLVDNIEWDETTKEIAGDPRTILPANGDHILGVIVGYRPTVILCFGRIAQAAVSPIAETMGIPVISGPHPAARQADVPLRLIAMAGALLEINKP